MKKINLYLFALLSIFIACGSPKNNQNDSKPKQFKWTNEILGIPYKISYTGKEDYQSQIDSLTNHLIHLFSEKNPSSVVSSINKQKTTEIEDKDALFVLQSALSVCEETNHAFDPTVKPLYDLFNEYSYDDLLKKTLDTNYYHSILGCEKVTVSNINNSKIIVEKSTNDVKLTLGGIYKGYVVDKIAQFLNTKKVNNFYVELGKTPHVKCSGEMNHSWNVVIKEPKTDSSVIYHTEKMVIDLKNKGLACSDVNTQAYKIEDKLITPYFSISPIGLAQTDLVNAIIIADQTMLCDAYATAIVIMGKDKAIEYLQKHPEIEAIITYLDENNELKKYTTAGVEQIYHLVE